MKDQIRINEIFYSVQGEGFWTGTPMVFVRFSGCNRRCNFCDTSHETFELMSIDTIVNEVKKYDACRTVLITGGEPFLQLAGIHALARALHSLGYSIHVETNGDFYVPPMLVDWITVSPKGLDFVQRTGNEMKVVFQDQSRDELDNFLLSTSFPWYYLQPCACKGKMNIEETIQYIKSDPRWRLSLQVHKLIGVR